MRSRWQLKLTAGPFGRHRINMNAIVSLRDRVWLLAEGRNLAVGTPEEIHNNPPVLAAYLGK